jgi:hypothetical protein
MTSLRATSTSMPLRMIIQAPGTLTKCELMLGNTAVADDYSGARYSTVDQV